MDKNNNFIHLSPLAAGQKDKGRSKNPILKEENASPRQLVALRQAYKTKAAKVFLSVFLLFSATAIIAVSGPSHSAYAISFKSTKNLSNNDGD
jgi:hypothetical protein